MSTPDIPPDVLARAVAIAQAEKLAAEGFAQVSADPVAGTAVFEARAASLSVGDLEDFLAPLAGRDLDRVAVSFGPPALVSVRVRT